MTSQPSTQALCVVALVACAILLQGCEQKSSASSSGSGSIGECKLMQAVKVNGKDAQIHAKLTCTKTEWSSSFLKDHDAEESSFEDEEESSFEDEDEESFAHRNTSIVNDSMNESLSKPRGRSSSSKSHKSSRSHSRKYKSHASSRRRVKREYRQCKAPDTSHVMCPSGTTPDPIYINGMTTRCTGDGAKRLVQACAGAEIALIQAQSNASDNDVQQAQSNAPYHDVKATRPLKSVKRLGTGSVSITDH